MADRLARQCAIQVDLDGRWVIERLIDTSRDCPIDPDPVFGRGLERLLAIFDEFRIRATFFVVAKDLASPVKSSLVRSLAAAGHEIASHGLNHAYLSGLDPDAVRREIVESKSMIERSCAVAVSGFKAPGFAGSRAIVPDLEEAGYAYDSSVLPTPIGVLMQLASRVRYPKRSMWLAPAAPYVPARSDLYARGESAIVEVPVSTLPVLRTPAHFSYSLAGGPFYHALVRRAFSGAVRPMTAVYLFHPLDLVSEAEAGLSKRVSGITVPVARKVTMARELLRVLAAGYDIVKTGDLGPVTMWRAHAAS